MIIDKDSIRSITERSLIDLALYLGADYELLQCQVLQPIDRTRPKNRIFVLEFPTNAIHENGIIIDDIDGKMEQILTQARTGNFLCLDNSLVITKIESIDFTSTNIQSVSTQSDSFFVFFHEDNAESSYSYNIYYKGIAVAQSHIFDNPGDFDRYKKKLSMHDMDRVFDAYQDTLNHKVLNDCFFLRECEKTDSQKAKPNLLRSSPEELFQKHFVCFIKENSSMEALQELQMIDNKRCDVLLQEASKFIIIEIKWMGESAGNPNSVGSYSFKIPKIQDGINQIFQYLHMGKSVVKSDYWGYLMVYDARHTKTDETQYISDHISKIIVNADYREVKTNYYGGCKVIVLDQ